MRDFEKDAVVALLVRMSDAAQMWQVQSLISARFSELKEASVKEYSAASSALKNVFNIDREAADFQQTIESLIGSDRRSKINSLTRSPRQAADLAMADVLHLLREKYKDEPAIEEAAKSSESDRETIPEESDEQIETQEANIKDRVLALLKEAGEAGTTATRIRSLLRSQGIEMHDKTVGMNLWRLSTEHPPQAKRNGKTWYYIEPLHSEDKFSQESAPINDIFS